MKSITIIFALLLAGVYAVSVPYVPQVQDDAIVGKEPLFVGDLVSSAIEDLSDQIRDAGLDPWAFDRTSLDFELPVPVVFAINAIAKNIVFRGLSNIAINHINYGILSGRLTLDISLPEVSFSIENVSLDAVALASNINFHLSGRFAVIEPRVSGEVVLSVLGGIIGGNIIRSMNLEFDLERIEYNGRFHLLGMDLTDQVSTFVSVNIPNAIAEQKNEINKLVEIIARQIIQDLVSSN